MAQAEIYSAKGAAKGQRKRQRTLKLMRKNWILYLFLLPAIAYIGVFHYGPMYGIQLAFRDFAPSLGIWGSPFVGMKYFDMFFSSPRFSMLLSNTIILSVYNCLLYTSANVACATVAVTTLACGVNRGVEAVTGENYGAKLMGEEGYERFEIATTMASTAISMAPSYLPYPSTGRTIPNNLKEQMKYRYAIQDKTRGKVIIPYLKDSRMPGWMGWQKYSIYGDGVDIHYVGHRFLPVRFDYKIK